MEAIKLDPLISEDRIKLKLKEVALEIQKDYQGKSLVILMVLKGSLCLVADLIRELTVPLDVETVQCSSYGSRGKKRGQVQIKGIEELKLFGRDVLVVDDIFDSGYTLVTLIEVLKKKKPNSLKTCVLLSKQNVFKVTQYCPNYTLFDIQNEFVVGYGLDFKERYRNLKGVYILKGV